MANLGRVFLPKVLHLYLTSSIFSLLAAPLPGLHGANIDSMEQQWDATRSAGNVDQPQRDFLAEATRLALQLDPVSWEFDLSDRDVDNASDVCNAQQLHFNNTAMATVRRSFSGFAFVHATHLD